MVAVHEKAKQAQLQTVGRCGGDNEAPFAHISNMEMIGGCCVCLDERGWDENPLVYCDGEGCNVAVHQACYGIVKVPSGPWFCCKCRSTERVARVKCELCPFKEGALKRTDNGGWAHVVCALYIPEVRFGNVTTMEPIKMSSVPHERFLKTCYICEEAGRESKTSNGACMSCNKPGCKLNFHVTCAQAKRMLCEEAGHYGNVQYVGYCSQHWGKRSARNHAVSAASEHDKKQKEKKRNRHDSISNSDGTKGKKKEKTLNAPKSGSNSSGADQAMPEKSDRSSSCEKTPSNFAKAGSAEKSAAESLNLLQQMPGLLTYFPNNNEPKTPLNSLISADESSSNTNNFDMVNILSSEQDEKIRTSPSYEEFIDVVDARKTPDEIGRKIDDKKKFSSSVNENGQDSCGKATSHPKKVAPSSQHKHAKLLSSDNKKRKSLSMDGEKNLKKKKAEEKRKVKKKLQKSSDFSIPRPPQMDLFENDRIPSLFPRNFGDKNPESFQDLLEFQWNQGAQFLIQKANHYDVGSLLSCLYQLRAENEDLEKRLEHLSARRDRLIAATTRLSTPLASPTNPERQVPLSAMLAKLKTEPNESNAAEYKQTMGRDHPSDSSTAGSSAQQCGSRSSPFEPHELHDKEHPDTSAVDFDCKEVLSEDNSVSGTPPRDIRKMKQPRKDPKTKTNDSERNGVMLQNSLVQPPIVPPTDPHIVGGITASHPTHNSSGFIQQVIRQQQQQQQQQREGHAPSANLLDFVNGQGHLLGNFKPADHLSRDGRHAANNQAK